MKIYSMTATFGKLANDTLTLHPGLNVIHAPNEWGKSTWSAFIVCMLYGIDTKERTTQSSLADKDRYAPWSGAPMSGRMELCWNGRDITIERTSKGRVPMGEFRAYETQSGLPVPELTAANCGQMLLGVEKSVFQRSGFVRLSDMPVTQDEALRRRLNALVTTGDESGTADALYEKLNSLRNKCRLNKTVGLLPQMESQRSEVSGKLERLNALRQLTTTIELQQEENNQEIQSLKNHQLTLAYEAALADAQKVQVAQQACLDAEEDYRQMERYCESIPSRENAEACILQLEQLRMDQDLLQSEVLPPVPQLPETPGCFAGMSHQLALQQAQKDEITYKALAKSRFSPLLILGILALVAVIPVAVLWSKAISLGLLVAGAILAAIPIRQGNLRKKELQKIAQRYGLLPADAWVATAQKYCDAMTMYEASEKAYRKAAESLQARKEQMQDTIDDYTSGHTISQCLLDCQKTLAEHNKLPRAYEKWQQALHHAKALAEMAKLPPRPEAEDFLDHSPTETSRRLAAAEERAKNLVDQLGQCKGQIESLGQESTLQAQLAQIDARIAKLEETYDALTLAMNTLTTATSELQRRFAPRIAQRAQVLFEKLTGGRYDRLQLTQELGVEAAAAGETVPQEARRRSDGTIDQLYLALRLAVAEELTPKAPLVLDDALVRFDDTRLGAAMDILWEAAQEKQVILFSCHTREQA